MKRTESKEYLSTLDIYLAAFLVLHRLPPTLNNNNGRVTFSFEVSPALYQLADAYNSNEPVLVADFVTAVKALRGRMLTMRNEIR